MRGILRTALAATIALTLAAQAQAEIKLTISNMHMCCEGCSKAVEKALAPVPGVKAEVDQDGATTTITAANVQSAQAALDALAAAGFHGQSDNPEVVIKDDSGAMGKTKKIELSGAHNCCGACTRAIKEAIESVPGAKPGEIKPKTASFTVEGDFDAAVLVKALNDAGFHVKKSG